MASRAPSRMTNASTPAPQDPDAAWPLTTNLDDVNSRKWFILTYTFGSEFPEGTPVIIREHQGMPNTQPPTPQAGGGGEATGHHAPLPADKRTKHDTLYRFYKLDVVERRKQCRTEDGVNAVLASKLSLQPGGRPIPVNGRLLDEDTMVYLLEDVDRVRVPGLPFPPGLIAPKGMRVSICGNTSRDGIGGRPLASAARHTTSTRYVLYVTVVTEERTWVRCRTAGNHYNFRRPRLSDKATIDDLNRRAAIPHVVPTTPSDLAGNHAGAGGANA